MVTDYQTAHSTVLTEVDDPVPFHRGLTWGAIFAGAVAALAIHILLTMLAAALGFGAIDPLRDDNPVATISLGAGIAWTVSALIAMFVGGWVAGRFMTKGDTTGYLHGFMVWSVATAAMFMMILLGAGFIAGGTFAVLGDGLAMAGRPLAAMADEAGDLIEQDLARNDAMLGSFADEATLAGSRGVDSPESIRAKRDIGMAIGRVFASGQNIESPENRATLVRTLVESGGMTEERANELVTSWTATYNQLKTDLESAKANAEQRARETADAASKSLSMAAVWSFAGYLLGAFIAALGGSCGAARALRHGTRVATTRESYTTTIPPTAQPM
jgi:hypothetical protein